MFKIVTAYNSNFEELGDITSKNKREYAKKHGYSFDYKFITDSEYPPNWAKLLVLMAMMTKSGDWIMWTDADSLIMNFNLRLEDMVMEDKIAVFGLHCVNYETHDYYPHGGNFLIKDCEESLDFLHRCMNRFGHEVNDRMMEERAFRSVMKMDSKMALKIGLVKLDKFCTVPIDVLFLGAVGFPAYRDGNFINHFMSPLTMEKRIQLVNSNLDKVIK